MRGALARRAFFAALSRMRGGRLELEEDGRRFSFGATGAELDARIEVRDRRAYSWALRGSTGLGEGYVEGLWATDDLVSVIRIACRNLAPWDRWRRRIHPLVGPLEPLLGAPYPHCEFSVHPGFELMFAVYNAIGTVTVNWPNSRSATKAPSTSATSCSRINT